MPKAKITPELERDWQIIQMRNVLDPKRHYRKDKRKKPPTYCQVSCKTSLSSSHLNRLA
jgi:hypothetical protein